jgi:hypothetical protein
MNPINQRWTILSTEYINQRKHYHVICTCGYKGVRQARYIDSNRSTCCKSCSSKDNKALVKNLKCGSDAMKATSNSVGELSGKKYAGIKGGATRRNLSFNVSSKFIWNLFLKQERQCSMTGMVLSFEEASLDRIDSSRGYEEDNVQWVHYRLNIMKGNLHQRDFVNWCHLVSSNNPELCDSSFIHKNLKHSG